MVDNHIFQEVFRDAPEIYRDWNLPVLPNLEIIRISQTPLHEEEIEPVPAIIMGEALPPAEPFPSNVQPFSLSAHESASTLVRNSSMQSLEDEVQRLSSEPIPLPSTYPTISAETLSKPQLETNHATPSPPSPSRQSSTLIPREQEINVISDDEDADVASSLLQRAESTTKNPVADQDGARL